MNNRVKETYNQLADDYEHNVDTNSPFNTQYERPAMMNLLPSDLRNNKVLDAGCAAGWYTKQLIHLGAVVTATDISPKMVEATKRRVGEAASVFCIDLGEKLPFEDETFDWIISSLVLHYIKDWSSTFKEFQRILNPGGKLLFSVHHPFMDFKLSENGDYFSNEFIIDQWEREGKMIEVPFYRRPLQMILNDTLVHFFIEQIIEPQPTEEFKMNEPEKYERLMKNPHFMIVKAIKKGNTRD
ncbi:class I SAM-dependent methyltransferase [Psychrobacillus sp. FJAT-21963]|uniref:class I SAM-dependent methyltransferase n=1 Tax=Psychrobacillus sp. FJAT-21963 TaxID=1712028 RepID=UPI0006F8D1D6|nr:class I SAM-dependent methyltransferase [Psychrobacillus sp. FJAT-21963]KQL32471.1 ubiquinone biosynthesis methyltransferase UbiE [Psychrobacillus sp. FJAT-21963]